MSKSVNKPASNNTRRRLPPEARKRIIVDEAIQYFAEVGLTGDTRELAKRIGITQPLLYRYFPTKENLIDRVFTKLYLDRLKPSWIDFIEDRSLPLVERLNIFAKKYAEQTFREEWIRIYAYAGLKDGQFNKRYIRTVTNPYLKAICQEIRHSLQLRPEVHQRPVDATELNLVWIWHGGLYYWAIRKHIYKSKTVGNLNELIEYSVHGLLSSMDAFWQANDRCR